MNEKSLMEISNLKKTLFEKFKINERSKINNCTQNIFILQIKLNYKLNFRLF